MLLYVHVYQGRAQLTIFISLNFLRNVHSNVKPTIGPHIGVTWLWLTDFAKNCFSIHVVALVSQARSTPLTQNLTRLHTLCCRSIYNCIAHQNKISTSTTSIYTMSQLAHGSWLVNWYWFRSDESFHDVECVSIRLQTQQFLCLVCPHPEVAVVVDTQYGRLFLIPAGQPHNWATGKRERDTQSYTITYSRKYWWELKLIWQLGPKLSLHITSRFKLGGLVRGRLGAMYGTILLHKTFLYSNCIHPPS